MANMQTTKTTPGAVFHHGRSDLKEQQPNQAPELGLLNLCCHPRAGKIPPAE
jgi:hypothetical protein